MADPSSLFTNYSLLTLTFVTSDSISSVLPQRCSPWLLSTFHHKAFRTSQLVSPTSQNFHKEISQAKRFQLITKYIDRTLWRSAQKMLFGSSLEFGIHKIGKYIFIRSNLSQKCGSRATPHTSAIGNLHRNLDRCLINRWRQQLTFPWIMLDVTHLSVSLAASFCPSPLVQNSLPPCLLVKCAGTLHPANALPLPGDLPSAALVLKPAEAAGAALTPTLPVTGRFSWL